MNNNDCFSCSRKALSFCCLTPEQLGLMNDNKRTITYKKGETIIKQGTRFTEVVSFNAGLAKMNIEINSTTNLLIGLIQPTEIIAGPGMFTDNIYTFSVTSLTNSTLCFIDVDIFKKILIENERFSELFMNSFSKRYIETCKRLVSLTHKQIHGRVAEALLFLSESVFKSNNFDLYMSRQELADFTGMSKESICRVLKEFNDEQIVISQGKNINILDKEHLSRIYQAG